MLPEKICLIINLLLKTKCMVQNWFNSLSVHLIWIHEECSFKHQHISDLAERFQSAPAPRDESSPRTGGKERIPRPGQYKATLWNNSHPLPHLPTSSLVVLWGGGDSHLWIWFCLRCLGIDWFAYLWENFVEKCIKDAHCKDSCVFLFIF